MGVYQGYTVALGICTLVALGLITRLWPVRTRPGAYPLLGMISCVAVWSFTAIFEIVTPELAGKVAWSKVEYLAIPFVAPTVFSFSLSYGGRARWFRGWKSLLVGIIPLVTCVLAMTNGAHTLIWTSTSLPPGPIGPLIVAHGPWFTIHVAYSYTLLVASTAVLTVMSFRGQALYRRQAAMMLASMIFPWAANALYLSGALPPASPDLTPVAFTLTVTALAISAARFRFVDVAPVAQSTILDSMLDGLIVVDAQGRVVEMNHAAEGLLGARAESLVGHDAAQALPQWQAWVQETAPGAETSRQVTRTTPSGERVLTVRITRAPESRRESRPLLALLTDITERTEAESRISLLAAALEAVENGVVITDAAGRIQWANPAFTRLTGYPVAEAAGRNPRILSSGRHPREFYEEMWGTISSGRVWHGELCNRRKDGTEYMEEMTITPLVQPDGRVSSYIAIKQDVSGRKRAEEALRKAHEQSQEANQLKTRLLASVSHDLRNPLGGIIGNAEMLQSGALGGLNADQNASVTDIIDAGGELLSFVNNIIGQAQLETGRVVLRPTLFSPSEMVESVLASTRYLAARKRVTVESRVDPALPGRILGDPYWLRQILVNLVGNALKFTEDGRVCVRICPAGEGLWMMEVSDTGPGIAEQDLAVIFESFRQTTTGAGKGGSGLGLAIVSQLTGLMNGRVAVQSTLGKGSVFTVTLPRAAAASAG
jgi:PAS domain S-box-containing protein